jgi:hypothetical protein
LPSATSAFAVSCSWSLSMVPPERSLSALDYPG